MDPGLVVVDAVCRCRLLSLLVVVVCVLVVDVVVVGVLVVDVVVRGGVVFVVLVVNVVCCS